MLLTGSGLGITYQKWTPISEWTIYTDITNCYMREAETFLPVGIGGFGLLFHTLLLVCSSWHTTSFKATEYGTPWQSTPLTSEPLSYATKAPSYIIVGSGGFGLFASISLLLYRSWHTHRESVARLFRGYSYWIDHVSALPHYHNQDHTFKCLNAFM